MTIAVALSGDLAMIPDLTGLTIAAAEDELTARSFSIGLTEPSLDPKLVVKSQVPKPGLQRPAGTPVNLFSAGVPHAAPREAGRRPTEPQPPPRPRMQLQRRRR